MTADTASTTSPPGSLSSQQPRALNMSPEMREWLVGRLAPTLLRELTLFVREQMQPVTPFSSAPVFSASSYPVW